MKNSKLKYIAKIGILAAIAAVVQLIAFPLPFIAPSFYDMDLSDVPALIGAFSLGPVAGVIIEFIKNCLHIVIKGTSTAFVGEFANFITGCALVLPASIIYKYRKNLKSAVIGMLVSIASFVVVGALLNYFVLIPTFSELFKLPLDSIVAMGTEINPYITDLKTLVIISVAPFNFLKSLAVSVVTILLYKRVSPVLHI